MMRITLNTSALLHIYSGITSACFENKEENSYIDMNTIPRSVRVLKDNLASLIELDCVVYKKNLTVFNSPFINSYSKDAKDILNIDFNITGLLLIEKCLESRVETLWSQADEAREDQRILIGIFEEMTELESLLAYVQEYMKPLYN